MEETVKSRLTDQCGERVENLLFSKNFVEIVDLLFVVEDLLEFLRGFFKDYVSALTSS